MLALTMVGVASCEIPARPHRETKDRVSDDERAALVRAPMRIVNEGHFERGVAAFEAQLDQVRRRHGPQSLEVADFIDAFALQLFINDHQVQSIPYFRRAMDAYRATYGSNHPETALAVNDYAQALEETYPDEIRPEVIPALEEAHRIRLATLGSHNAETAMSAAYLARATGDPKVIQGDAARLDAVVAMLRAALVDLAAAPNALPRDEYAIRDRLAIVLRENGRIKAASIEADLRDRVSSADPDFWVALRQEFRKVSNAFARPFAEADKDGPRPR